MNIGYACLALCVPGTRIKSCKLENAKDDMLAGLIKNNLQALKIILQYNQSNDIKLFRISSDIIPFASHPKVSINWQDAFRDQLMHIGSFIKDAGMRVSMHPGQYTVLNSDKADIVQRSVEDLAYHADFLDGLGTDASNKIILHIGGVYGDKKRSLKRFAEHFSSLPENIKQRLCIENDDRHFHIGDVMELGSALALPVVFDTLHHAVNPCDAMDGYGWIQEAKRTWGMKDGRQKIHYSQQDAQKGRGAHSATIEVKQFLEFYAGLPCKDLDIMLEVKDKNLSAVKCVLCIADNGKITKLEQEFSRYKFTVLEKNPSGYQALRRLLKDGAGYKALDFYEIIRQTLKMPEVKENAQNVALHVWGYFKQLVSEREKERFFRLLNDYMSGKASLRFLKNYLFRLAVGYNMQYLLRSYYFCQIVE